MVTPTWEASFEGVLADELAALARGAESRRLTLLAATNAAAAAVLSWRSLSWIPLTALDAVRLDGFDTLFLELVGLCNERCIHCYAESGPAVTAALARDVCEAIVDDAIELGFRRIQFTGGDPLLCSFLPDLVARAQPLEVREIYTNGLALTEELVDRLAPHAPSFAFSYYSHDPEIHDAITRTPGSHRRTRAAIQRVVARKLPVRAAMVIFNENVDGVDRTVDELRAMGVQLVSTAASKTAGRGKSFAWQPRNPAIGSNAGHRAADARSEGKLCVTYEGDVVPCIFNRSRVLGKVNSTRRLRDVVASMVIPDGPMATAEKLSCGSCRLTDHALGAVRGA